MNSNYPNSIVSWVDRVDNTLGEDVMASDVNQTYAEIIAMESDLSNNIKPTITANTNLIATKRAVDIKIDIPDLSPALLAQVNSNAKQLEPTSNIFTHGVDFGSLYFRIPHIITTIHGTIVGGGDVIYNGNSDFGIADQGMARSVDGGLTWINKQIVIYNNNINGYSRVMDGCMLYDPILDKIFLFAVKLDDSLTWYTKTDKTNWDLCYVSSLDDGITWTAPVSIKTIIDGFSNRLLFLTGVGTGIVQDNGWYIVPIQCSNVGQLPFGMQSGIMYSKDSGATWTICTTLIPEYSSECNVIEWIGAGGILLNARSDGSGKRTLYNTTDLGVTWTPTLGNYVNSPNVLIQQQGCQASMIKVALPNGRQKLLYSAPHNLVNNRSNPSLMSSVTGGNSWDMVSTIYPSTSDGYSCLSYNATNATLYVVEEIAGDIIFKDISKFINIVERDVVMTPVAIPSTYTLYVSNAGSDANTGISATVPLKTIAYALTQFNYAKGNSLIITLLDDSLENITITNIQNAESLTIMSDSLTVRALGSLSVTNCYTRISLQYVKFNGMVDATNGMYIFDVRNINFLNCLITSSSSRLIYTSYCGINMTSCTFTKIGSATMDAIYFDVGTISDVFGSIFTATGFRYGVCASRCNVNVSGTTGDGSITEGATSIITNSVNPLKVIGVSTITCNIVIGVGAYQNGWAVGTVALRQWLYTGRKATLVGGIKKGTGTLTTGTALTSLPIILPRYTQYRQAIGIVTSGTILVMIKLDSATGNILLAQTIGDSTLTEIIFDGISFDVLV